MQLFTLTALLPLLALTTAEPVRFVARAPIIEQQCTATNPRGYHCGTTGELEANTFYRTTKDTTVEACRDSCIYDPKCHSFGFGQQSDREDGEEAEKRSLRRTGPLCSLYPTSLKAMGIFKEPEGRQFWNRHCFCCTNSPKQDGCMEKL